MAAGAADEESFDLVAIFSIRENLLISKVLH